MDFTDKRMSYEKGMLDESIVPQSPFTLLEQWINEAIEHNTPEPYAMSFASCGNDMMPAVRTVLMREITENGLIFYTNYLSDKGQDLEQNPMAESLFFWHDMQRQVRVRGAISKIARAKTDAYFQKRPYESQIGAWVSQPQSGEIADRAAMNDRFAQLKAKYPEGGIVPTPDFWGGYELTAAEFEFWQGRPNRLHDRLLYSRSANHSNQAQSNWTLKRLLP